MIFDDDTERMLSWENTCAKAIGVVLPLNWLAYDEETQTISIGYMANYGEPPLITRQGKAVRIVSLNYSHEESTCATLH